MNVLDVPLTRQAAWLLLLALPVACVAWTVTHEEVFREPREYCEKQSENCRSAFVRKFFYLFTCEYCFSHYVAAFFIGISAYRLLFDDWRGVVIAFFAVVWIANLYMGVFARLRLEIKAERLEIDEAEHSLEDARRKATRKR